MGIYKSNIRALALKLFLFFSILFLYQNCGQFKGSTGSSSSGFVVGASCKPDVGHSPIHRLSQTEYKNTLRDLFGTSAQDAMSFPTEFSRGGFDNNAGDMEIRADTLNVFMETAQAVMEEAFQSRAGEFLICDPQSVGEENCLDQILALWGKRIFRRPLLAVETQELKNLFNQIKPQGTSFQENIQVLLEAMLVQPQFLYRMENRDGGNSPRRVDAFELATRLSYLIWASTPDDNLLDRAEDGSLLDGMVLENQVERMLIDPRSTALVDNFVHQWLHLGDLDEFEGDPNLFPEFDEQLRMDMKTEIEMFLRDNIESGGDLRELFSAQHSFVNRNIASLYGIQAPSGDGFQRVSLANTNRSGLITFSGILTMTSQPNRTSAVERGYWVLKTFICSEPGAPPANLPPLESAPSNGSPREQLSAHRSDPACIGCHRFMDPIGFSLDNFDVIGRWRTTYEGFPVDNSAELPDGATFEGHRGLSQYLSQSEQVRQCISSKLMTYALGRISRENDGCSSQGVVESINTGTEKFSLKNLILNLTKSYSFQHTRGE